MITRASRTKARAVFSLASKNSLERSRDIIVFSHLRWEFVTQRPQHLLTRLSKKHRILFVEEPIHHDIKQRGTAHLIKPSKRITVLQPRIAGLDLPELARLVQQQPAALKLSDPLVWFYSPMFLGILDYLEEPSAIVFDCMDELSAFKGAPPELIAQEKSLLAKADVVFTGGRSLYEAKKKFNKNTYCFPSSVDQAHFEKTLAKGTRIPPDAKSIPHPIVGYYGVIDERIDLVLLRKVALAIPEVSFVMIGPVVKISEADLPQAVNLHYLGSKDYKELPSYLKAIDIAMMPFALNASTKFISPTKTLEYMAALKPIVSTPIYDVVRSYRKEVVIAKNAEQFVRGIRSYMRETPAQRRRRETLFRAILKQTSWDKTAAAMELLIKKAIKS